VDLQPGEILIAPFTDAAWTPLFIPAAGVVVETGGLLSHAAIVAREFGIPAVVAVKGATSVIQDGQTVTIDGAAGTVTLG
jgi:pyruvate,water dikinase